MSSPVRLRSAFFAAILLFGTVSLLPSGSAEAWIKNDLGKPYTDVGSGLYGIAVGDGDRDNATEVYVTSVDNGHVYEFHYAGGKWSSTDLGALCQTGYADAVLIGDADDDNKTEVYATCMFRTGGTYTNDVYQLAKTDAGWTKTDMGSAGYWGADIAIGDGNRDGRTELYSADSLYGHIYQFSKSNGWNTQDVGSAPPIEYNSWWYTPYMGGVAVGDGDNDGSVEVYGAASDNHIYRFNYSNSAWNRTDMGTGEVLDPTWGMRGMTLGDGDNDGKNEVYGYSMWNGTIWQYEWNSTSRAWGITRLHILGTSISVLDIVVGDGNSDGKNEIYFGTSDRQVDLLAYNAATGQWQASSIGSGTDQINAVDIGSCTNDTAQKEVYAACGDGHAYQFYIDRVPPANPLVWSDTHPVPGTWYNNNRVHVLWRDVGSDISGIDGYSIQWDTSPDTVPDDVRDLQEDVHDATSPPLADGTYYFHIRARDNTLNWNASATHFGPICIDTDPPWSVGIIINSGDEYTNNSLVTLSITSTTGPSGSGPGLMSFSNDGNTWSAWEGFCATRTGWDLTDAKTGGNGTDGTKTVHLRIKDLAGNELPAANRSSDSIFLDRVAPGNLIVSINGGAAYTASPDVLLNLSARDPEPASGLWRMGFSNDATSWSDWTGWCATAAWSLTTDPGGTDADGEKSVYFRLMDRAGNLGGPVYDTIVLDRKEPGNLSVVINDGDAFTNSSLVNLLISADDPIPGSQLSEMLLSNDAGASGSWEPYSVGKFGWSLTSGAGGADTDGNKQVSLKVRDRAGNIAGPVADTIFLDRARPLQLSISINGNATYTTSPIVQLALAATDPEPASGVQAMQFSSDGNDWTAWEPFAAKKNFTLPPPDGTKTVYFRVEDIAGNIADAANDTIILDTAPPLIWGVAVSAITDRSAVVSWTTNEEADSGVDYGPTTAYGSSKLDPSFASSHSVALSGLSPSTTYHFRVGSKDRAGNIPTYSGDFTFVTATAPDTTPPTIYGVRVSGITDRLAVVSWSTNEPADSLVDYGPDISYGMVVRQAGFVLARSLVLTDLTPSTTYHFRVSSTDPSGNGPARSADRVFTTPAAPDTRPPVISNIRVSGITDRLAVVTWETDEPADGTVEYGLTMSYGLSASHSGLMAVHQVTLTGLTSSTAYHFRIRCSDATGNGPSLSADMVFSTLAAPDNRPPAISNVRVEAITGSSAVVVWETDELADSMVEYGLTAVYGLTAADPNYMFLHSVPLQNLSKDTTYHVRVRSADPSGNAAAGEDLVFRTGKVPPGTDTTPPVISGLEVRGVSNTGAVVLWTTDEPADSTVEYGTTASYGLRSSERTYLLVHSVVLDGLTPSTEYHVRVSSTDVSGNGPSVSQDISFFTSATPDRLPPQILDLNYSGLTNDSVLITWRTDEPADSFVEFGTSGAFTKNITSRTYVLYHSLRLTGLQPGTTYHFRVTSVDPSGNPSTPSADRTFTTLKVYPPVSPGPGPRPRPAGGELTWIWAALALLIAVAVCTGYLVSRRAKRTKGIDAEHGDAETAVEEETIETLPMDEPIEAHSPPLPPSSPHPSSAAFPRSVRCTGCGARVPVPSTGYPVRITCPGCGRSGTYSGPRSRVGH